MSKTIKTLVAALAVSLTAAGQMALAQTEAKQEESKPATKVYHAGGRHDVYSHEASVRAKEKGAKMTEPAVHAGGRHNEDNHKAAIQAQKREDAKSIEAK